MGEKYRPKVDKIIGQDIIVNSIEKILNGSFSHMLFMVFQVQVRLLL